MRLLRSYFTQNSNQISLSLQVFIESVQRLLDSNLEAARLPPIAIATMIATILIKSAVWVWCRAIKNSSVEALAQDAENDVCSTHLDDETVLM